MQAASLPSPPAITLVPIGHLSHHTFAFTPGHALNSCECLLMPQYWLLVCPACGTELPHKRLDGGGWIPAD
eukprot:1146305-Pelagomonas_calceolata.AAC.8